MDALEPSEPMMALAVAKKIYTKHILEFLDSRGSSIDSGQCACYMVKLFKKTKVNGMLTKQLSASVRK